MSFAIGAANVPTLDNWVAPVLTPRIDSLYPVIHARNDSAPNTVNLFIDSVDEDYEYGASVITACADQTVYAIQCTAGPRFVGSATCGSNAPKLTVTSAPSTYIFSSDITTVTRGITVTVIAQESCKLAGTTAATCTATVKGGADGTSTSSTATSVLTGANYYRFDVPITAGAEKTASATAKCAGKSAAVNLNAKNAVYWALAGVAGITSILTML